MKLLVSAMTLALALAWPGPGEAQSKKKPKAKSTASSQQVVRHARPAVRTTAARPCAARVSYIGCLGWDPDPNVRSMIQMDAGLFDH
jgi:hypothetical protein